MTFGARRALGVGASARYEDTQRTQRNQLPAQRAAGGDPPDQRFICLTEELGELGHALLAARGLKSDSNDEPLDVAFAGVLFELLVLARLYGVDVERGYERGLATLAERRGLDVEALRSPEPAPDRPADDGNDPGTRVARGGAAPRPKPSVRAFSRAAEQYD